MIDCRILEFKRPQLLLDVARLAPLLVHTYLDFFTCLKSLLSYLARSDGGSGRAHDGEGSSRG